MSGSPLLDMAAVERYRRRLRYALEVEQHASVVEREAQRAAQMIEYRLERCRSITLASVSGANAHRLRNTRRRLRAARAAHVRCNDVRNQQVLNCVDPIFDTGGHVASNPSSSAADATSAAGSPHRLSGDQI